MIRTHMFLVLISVAAVLCQNQPTSSQFKQLEVELDIDSSIPGVAGKDYPIFYEIPVTSFACSGKRPGYYADTDARCQVWHYCSLEGLIDSFLCPNGTIYSQERRVCEWYYDVDCTKTSKFVDVNKDLYVTVGTTKAPSRSALEKQQLVKDPETPQPVKNSNLRKRYIQF